jgi:hypothetical protein
MLATMEMRMSFYGRTRSQNLALARSRRRCAIHEAGHFVVASYLGYKPAESYIRRDGDNYHGLVSLKRQIRVPYFLRLFAVAGGVAVCCWENWETIEAYPFLSDWDWQLTGCARGEPDENCTQAFEWARSLLRRDGPHWSQLIGVARTLIIGARNEERFDKWYDEVKTRDAFKELCGEIEAWDDRL